MPLTSTGSSIENKRLDEEMKNYFDELDKFRSIKIADTNETVVDTLKPSSVNTISILLQIFDIF